MRTHLEALCLVMVLTLGASQSFACDGQQSVWGNNVQLAQSSDDSDPVKKLQDAVRKGLSGTPPPATDVPQRDSVGTKERAIRRFDDQQRLEAERRLLEK